MTNEHPFRKVEGSPEDENGAARQPNDPKLPPLYTRTPEYKERQRSRRRLRGAFQIVLLLALIGGVWYAWPWLSEQSAKLARIPEIQKALAVVEQRATDVEEELRLRRADWAGLRERLAGFDRRIDDGVAGAKRHAETVTAGVEKRIDGRLNATAAQLEDSLAQVRAAQDAESGRLAALRGEVNQLRDELGNTRLAAGRNRDETRGEFRNIQDRLEHGDERLAAISDRLHRDRIDFEVAKNVSREVAPGILLQLTATDVRRSRFKGWMRLTPEGRTMWFQDQGLNQPVLFYQKGTSQAGQLIITRVSKNDAVGYVLLPRPEQKTGGEAQVSGG